MSQDLTSEEVDRTAGGENDGMYRPERTQRETVLMVLRQAAEY